MDALTEPTGHRSTELDAEYDAWFHHTPDDTERWAAAGWDLHEAFVWQRVGFDEPDAFAWSAVIDQRQLPGARPVPSPGEWWTPIAVVAARARACVEAGFAPADYDAMAAVFNDPSDARDWLDAGFTLADAGEWGFALTVDTAQEAMEWRSAGWNVSKAVDLEAALMHVIGHETLFAPGGQAALTDACAAWRDTGLEPCRAITCLRAGLTTDEIASMTWDEHTTAAVQTLADLLTPCAH